ncbi:MAG: CCA tRNA nucleotidyltransferase [Chlamydiae bacterium]|nr:CCA tRNA nucleotidyltransferase [Chlamydiota bacterium]
MPTKLFAIKIVKTLARAGHIVYFAGGWVRDFLMQHPSDDIDIATSASTDEVQKLFPKTIPVGVSFGIVIVVQNGHQFEVATFRKDRGYVDGRRPTGIEPATPEEDALRRDFTINGMFYDPLNEKLYDYVGGEADIKKKIIRAIGNPHERFGEDRLRMMRAVRYSTRFNFPIESETLQAILIHAKELFPSVAMERVWQEFKKMSQFAHFDRGLATLHKLQLLSTIFPELANVSLEEVEKRVRFMRQFPKNTPTFVEVLELFPDHSFEQIIQLCDYLKLSKKEKAFAQFYYHSQNLLNMPKSWLDKLEKVEWAHFYANHYSDLCLQVHAARKEAEERREFIDHHTRQRELLKEPILRIQSANPIVKADHLMEEGIKPGKNLGKLLKEAERISVNEQLEDRKKIIEKLKKTPLWQDERS